MDNVAPFSLAEPGRRSVRLGCVTAALAVNLVAIAWVAPSPARPRNTALPTAMQVSATRLDGTGTLDAARSGRPSADAASSRTQHAPPRASAAPQAPASRTTAATPPPAAADSGPPLDIAAPAATARFYTFDEVEVPAAPADDWALDAATLDGARIGRLVFELFVDDAGKVVDCAIVEPTDLDAEVRASIEGRLRTTVLLPAMRTGHAVDSVRRIELTVS